MSTNFVHVVPTDPFFVPPPAVEDEARRWFAQAMPGGWEVTSTVVEPMGFVVAGEAGAGVHCPTCGAELDWQWVWSLLPDPPPTVVPPCCDRPVRLAEVRGDAGERFARFRLRITDPDDWDPPDAVLAGVDPDRRGVIWAGHYDWVLVAQRSMPAGVEGTTTWDIRTPPRPCRSSTCRPCTRARHGPV